jgi:hypothetical protein
LTVGSLMANKYGYELPTKLKWPSRMCVYGPPATGKSTLLLKLLKLRDYVFEEPAGEAFYLYSEDQSGFDEYRNLPGVTFSQSYKEVDEWISPTRNQLVIVDDFVLDLEKNTEFAGWITDLYVKRARHSSTTVIFATQNLFAKNLRILRLSCSNLVLFSSKTDSKTITVLASQIAPSNSAFVLKAYLDSVSEARGFLHIDFSSLKNTVHYTNFLWPELYRNKVFLNVETNQRQFAFPPKLTRV